MGTNNTKRRGADAPKNASISSSSNFEKEENTKKEKQRKSALTREIEGMFRNLGGGRRSINNC